MKPIWEGASWNSSLIWWGRFSQKVTFSPCLAFKAIRPNKNKFDKVEPDVNVLYLSHIEDMNTLDVSRGEWEKNIGAL